MNGPKRTFYRRVERWIVSLAMAALAFALEKLVLRSISRGAKAPPSGEARR